MNLFGLEGSSLIISLGLTLLISGIVMFYCLRRFATIENSVIQQGRILQSFISKMQERDMMLHAGRGPTQYHQQQQEQPQREKLSDKIEVSDDDSYSEYETDSNDSDDTDDIVVKENIELNISGEIKEIKEIPASQSNIELNIGLLESYNLDKTAPSNEVKIIAMEDLQMMSNTLSLSSSDSDDESDLENSIEELSSNSGGDLAKNVEELVVVKKGFSKMKVNELREMAVSNGIVDNNDVAGKMKKDDLIKLLQDQ